MALGPGLMAVEGAPHLTAWLIPADLLLAGQRGAWDGGGSLLLGGREEMAAPPSVPQGQRLWGPHCSPNSLTEERAGLLLGA